MEIEFVLIGHIIDRVWDIVYSGSIQRFTGRSSMKIFISYRRAEDNKSYLVGNIH